MLKCTGNNIMKFLSSQVLGYH